ncbi:DUF2397 family protein [Niallia sp. 03133]|uniref:DUF2397 family protein n=1 Tax=Niallia sp. 03133 TaxID=3458060 RepID=UPI0040450760
MRDFIVSLQKTSLQIRERLNELTPIKLESYFQKLIEYRKSIPRLEDVTSTTEEWKKEYIEYWGSLRQWFLGSSIQQSELEVLQWQTNEMIRRMTRYVQRIGERQQHFRSRKNDYLKLSQWFANCKRNTELFAMIYGILLLAKACLLQIRNILSIPFGRRL